jgi:hypothetical protein
MHKIRQTHDYCYSCFCFDTSIEYETTCKPCGKRQLGKFVLWLGDLTLARSNSLFSTWNKSVCHRGFMHVLIYSNCKAICKDDKTYICSGTTRTLRQELGNEEVQLCNVKISCYTRTSERDLYTELWV